MTSSHSASRCRIISIAPAKNSCSALDLIRNQPAINLSQLSESIQSDRSLSYRITEAACQEFGFAWLSLEEAIVLLGVPRIRTLLTAPRRPGRSAAQLRRILHRNRTAPCQLEPFQEEPV
jgi:HD-like signal output (HDOD) protein